MRKLTTAMTAGAAAGRAANIDQAKAADWIYN